MSEEAKIISDLVVDRFSSVGGGVASGGGLIKQSAALAPMCFAYEQRQQQQCSTEATPQNFLDGRLPGNDRSSSQSCRLPGIAYLMEADFHIPPSTSSASAVQQENELKKNFPPLKSVKRGDSSSSSEDEESENREMTSNNDLKLRRAEEVEEPDCFCSSLPDLQIVESSERHPRTLWRDAFGRVVDDPRVKARRNWAFALGQIDVLRAKKQQQAQRQKGRISSSSLSSLQERSRTLRLKSQKATERIKERSQSASRALVSKSRSFIAAKGNPSEKSASQSPKTKAKNDNNFSLHIDEDEFEERGRSRTKIKGYLFSTNV